MPLYWHIFLFGIFTPFIGFVGWIITKLFVPAPPRHIWSSDFLVTDWTTRDVSASKNLHRENTYMTLFLIMFVNKCVPQSQLQQLQQINHSSLSFLGTFIKRNNCFPPHLAMAVSIIGYIHQNTVLATVYSYLIACQRFVYENTLLNAAKSFMTEGFGKEKK